MPENEAFNIVDELTARLQRATSDEVEVLGALQRGELRNAQFSTSPLDDIQVVTISVPEFNALLESGLDMVAKKQPGYKSLRMVADDLQALTDKPRAGLDLEFYRSNVLTPKELAGGSIENAAKAAGKATIRKTVTGGEPTVGNPMSEEFISEIGQKFGAIEEDFKRRYRQARALLKAEGKPSSPPEAWAKVVSENYVRDTVTTMGPNDFLNLSYGQMFDDYISQIYGGYESIVDALNASGRTQFLDGMLVNPAEMRQLVQVMLQGDDLQKLRETFVALQSEGRHMEALTVLRDSHAYVQGKPIQSFIRSVDELDTLYQKAVTRSNLEQDYFTIDPLITKPYRTGGFRQDERGMLEIWDNAKESAPMFFVDDHVELLSTQYSTRRMAGIVEDVFDDWSRTYPELFPTNREILARAALLDEAFKGYIFNKQIQTSALLYTPGVKDLIEDTVSKAMPKMYVAAIDDQLTLMSGSTQKGKRLGEEIRKLKKQIKQLGGTPGAQRFFEGFADNLFDGDAYTYIARNSGASSYVSSIYPSLRAESTPLFYNTLKTAIRQAAKSNRDIIRTGVLESTLRAPLTFGETSNIRSSVIGKSNIDQFTETMMEMAIGSQFRKASPELLKSLEEGGSLTEKIQRGIDATTELRGQATKRGTGLVRTVNDLVGTPGAAFNDGRFSRTSYCLWITWSRLWWCRTKGYNL